MPWPPLPWPRQQASLGSASGPQGRGRVSGEGRAENEHHPSPKGPAWDADGQTDRWTESQNWRPCICSLGSSTRKPRSEPGRWAGGGPVPGSGLPAAPPAPALLHAQAASAGVRPAPPPSAMGFPARSSPWGSPAKLDVLVLGAPPAAPGPDYTPHGRALRSTRSLSSLPRAGDPGSCGQAGQ